MRKLRISAISFLNTAPLMWDFEHGVPPGGSSGQELPTELARDFEVEYTIPSQCAEALRAGTADIGIIPAVEFASIPELVIIPHVAIAAKGAVRSILLVSKVPLEQVQTLATDTASRTSVALTRVLFYKWFGRIPQFTPCTPHLDAMLSACDAALLIGDAALAVDRTQYQTWDLAEEWQRITGKSFVFAVWAVRMKALNEARPDLDVATVFRDSRDHGCTAEHIAVIAQQWGPRVGLSEAQVSDYLTRNIDFSLDAENIRGLELFFRCASECGAIAQSPAFRFLLGKKCALAAL